MKNIIGQPARGENFYDRTREIKKIISSLANGNHLQITAPRRVGKTSILWYLLDNDVANRHYVYIDTESVAEEEEFYKKLLNEILRNEQISSSKKVFKAFVNGVNRFFKKLESVGVLGNTITFKETAPQNYYEELYNFLTGYALAEDTELVILVDEFPQTIENIRKTDEEKARLFLKKNRELRLNPDLNGKVKFIYTGSIGLNHTVSRLDATASINDLNSIEIGPLTRDEAIDLFRQLLAPQQHTIAQSAINYLLDAIQWYIPFHIQLIVQEIMHQSEKATILTDNHIQQAINSIIDLRNQNHFDHYYTRLKAQFKDNAFKYADEALKTIAERGSMSKSELSDLSFKYEVDESYRNILESMIYDGYIHRTEQGNYVFNSPIVKLWWLKFIC